MFPKHPIRSLLQDPVSSASSPFRRPMTRTDPTVHPKLLWTRTHRNLPSCFRMKILRIKTMEPAVFPSCSAKKHGILPKRPCFHQPFIHISCRHLVGCRRFAGMASHRLKPLSRLVPFIGAASGPQGSLKTRPLN